MKDGKSSGSKGIPSEVLKAVAEGVQRVFDIGGVLRSLEVSTPGADQQEKRQSRAPDVVPTALYVRHGWEVTGETPY